MISPSIYRKAWKERHPSHLSYPLNEDCLETIEKGAGGSWIFISIKWAAVPMGLLALYIYCVLFFKYFSSIFRYFSSKQSPRNSLPKEPLAAGIVGYWKLWRLCSFVAVPKQEPISGKYCPASFPAGVARSLCLLCTGGRSKKLKSFLMVQNH